MYDFTQLICAFKFFDFQDIFVMFHFNLCSSSTGNEVCPYYCYLIISNTHIPGNLEENVSPTLPSVNVYPVNNYVLEILLLCAIHFPLYQIKSKIIIIALISVEIHVNLPSQVSSKQVPVICPTNLISPPYVFLSLPRTHTSVNFPLLRALDITVVGGLLRDEVHCFH